MLVEVVIWVLFYAFGLWTGSFVLVAVAENVATVGRITSGSDAHDDEVEYSDHAYEYRQGCVDGVLGVEKEKRDEDHEKTFSMHEADELEVLEDTLPLKLGRQEQACKWDKVDCQDVEERVRGAVIFAKVSEANDRCGQDSNHWE